MALGALLVLALGYFFALKPMARFLLIEDNSQKSDVIVVLGGGWTLERTAHAVSLYQRGYANRLLIVGAKLKLKKAPWVVNGKSISEPVLASLFANYLGVAKEAVTIDDRSPNTYQNAIAAREDLLKMGAKSATIVSSPYHMRRVYYVFNKAFKGTNISLYFSPAQEEGFKIDWKWTRGEINAIRHEYMGMAYYLIKRYI